MENKYQRGKIYKIISNHTDKIYIGSTTEPTLARRLTGHTQNYKSYLAGNDRYVSSYELLQHPDYKIILIESYPCNSKDELLSREQFHIDLAGEGCVNRFKAFTGLTKQEYKKQYDAENKEIIAEYKKQYNQENKEIIAERTKRYNKQYHVKNKEIIAEKKSQKVQCDCGSIISKHSKACHERSFIHTEYLKMLEA